MTIATATRPAPAVLPVLSPFEWEYRDEKRRFEELYDETVDTVFRYVLMFLRNQAEAEDATAEAYLRAWRKRHTFTARGTQLSWLLTIARNCALDAIRVRRPEFAVTTLFDHADPQWEGGNALDPADADLVREAMRQLTAEQQEVLFLRFYEELPHTVIATRLGRSATAIRAVQFRALARLRKLLEARGER